MQKIIKILAKLSVHDLEQLAGTTIVNAVKGAYNTNAERELARLVFDRYGKNILIQEKIRLALVDGLSKEEALAACTRIGLKNININLPQIALNDRFNSPFSNTKAQEFLKVFELDDSFLPVTIVDNRLSTEKIEAVFGETVTLKGVLHPYQRIVKDSICELLEIGYRKQMVQMPTGAGKTMTALEVIVDALRKPKFNNLLIWIVDSTELAEQALISFASLWKTRGDRPIHVHRFFGNFEVNFESCKAGVVFCTFGKVNSALKSSNSEQTKKIDRLSKKASLVIVDEAHSSVATTYSEVISKLVSYDAKLIGLSATPGRTNFESNLELGRMYGDKLVSIKNECGEVITDAVTYLQRNKYLANIEFVDLYSGFETTSDDVNKICIALSEHFMRNNQIIKQIEEAVNAKQPTIVYACTKDHVIALMALCRAKTIDADFIIGEVPSSKRNEIFDRFKNGSLMVIINHEILSTGIDLPNLKKIIITRPINSPILYSQILGRALRGPKNGGNEKNIVVNITDNLLKFPSASHIYKSFKNNFNQ